MRRMALLVAVACATSALFAPAAVGKAPKKARTERITYAAPIGALRVGLCPLNVNDPSTVCLGTDARAGESRVSIKVEDATRSKVSGSIFQAGWGSSVEFCGRTKVPVGVQPGFVQVFLHQGGCSGTEASLATVGEVVFTFTAR